MTTTQIDVATLTMDVKCPGENSGLRSCYPAHRFVDGHMTVPVSRLYMAGRMKCWGNNRVFYVVMLAGGKIAYLDFSKQTPEVRKVLKPVFAEFTAPIATKEAGVVIKWGSAIVPD